MAKLKKVNACMPPNSTKNNNKKTTTKNNNNKQKIKNNNKKQKTKTKHLTSK